MHGIRLLHMPTGNRRLIDLQKYKHIVALRICKLYAQGPQDAGYAW